MTGSSPGADHVGGLRTEPEQWRDRVTAFLLAIQPAELDSGYWLDGGIVDILPSEPFVTADRCDVAIVVNGF